jgi:hypothetical protein
VLGVCVDDPLGICCGKPAVDRVLCDLGPASTGCCYSVDFEASGICAG